MKGKKKEGTISRLFQAAPLHGGLSVLEFPGAPKTSPPALAHSPAAWSEVFDGILQVRSPYRKYRAYCPLLGHSPGLHIFSVQCSPSSDG